MGKTVSAGVGVMMIRDGKVLMGLRNPQKDKASSNLQGEGTWTFPGGKIDFGDSLESAAKREVMEETGLVVEELELLSVNNIIKGDFQYFTFGLICKDFSGEPKIMEPEEIVEWKWFALDSLPEKIYIASEKMLEMYKNKTLIILDEK